LISTKSAKNLDFWLFYVHSNQSPTDVLGYCKRSKHKQRAKQFKLLEDNDALDGFCCNKLLMKSKQLGYRVKMFNEDLKPLWCFLAKRLRFSSHTM